MSISIGIGKLNIGSGSQSSAPVVPVVPAFVSAIVENTTPTKIAVTFDVALDDTSVPYISAFLAESKMVTEVAISGAVVTLTVDAPFTAGETIVLTYVKPETNPLKSLTGGEALGFSEAIINNTAPVLPEIVSAETIDELSLSIFFNPILNSDIFPVQSSFDIKINNVSIGQDYNDGIGIVSPEGYVVINYYGIVFSYGDIITVSYTAPEENPLQGLDGGKVASFEDYPVTNNIEQIIPEIVSAEMDGNIGIKMLFSEPVNESIIPSMTSLDVKVNGVSKTMLLDGLESNILYTYREDEVDFSYGDIVTISYTAPALNPLQGLDGGKVASFTDYPVTNNIEFTPASVNDKLLFWGKVSDIADGTMPNKVTGSSDALTVGGSEGSYTFQVPDDQDYIDADTDFIWAKTDETIRTTTEAELVGYDFPRTLVKYDNTTPYAIREIIILLDGATLTDTEENLLRDYMELSIWWSDVSSDHGVTKGNRSEEQSHWTAEALLPTVTTTAITTIRKTTATSGGNVTDDGGDTVTARGVCWSTSADPTISDSKTTDSTGEGVFVSSITGLTANTVYHVRAYATNGIGTSYGSDVQFTSAEYTLLDTFTDTTGVHLHDHIMDIGPGWTSPSTTLVISGNKLINSAEATAIGLVDCGLGDFLLVWDIVLPAATTPFYTGFFFRYQDPTHYMAIWFEHDAGDFWYLTVIKDGVAIGTNIDITATYNTTKQLAIETLGDYFTIYWDAVSKRTVNDGAYKDKTVIGVRKNSGSGYQEIALDKVYIT
jgi:hypothetical protein